MLKIVVAIQEHRPVPKQRRFDDGRRLAILGQGSVEGRRLRMRDIEGGKRAHGEVGIGEGPVGCAPRRQRPRRVEKHDRGKARGQRQLTAPQRAGVEAPRQIDEQPEDRHQHEGKRNQQVPGIGVDHAVGAECEHGDERPGHGRPDPDSALALTAPQHRHCERYGHQPHEPGDAATHQQRRDIERAHRPGRAAPRDELQVLEHRLPSRKVERRTQQPGQDKGGQRRQQIAG